MNASIVAQPAEVIAARAGFELPEDKKFLIVPESGVGADHPFSGEKLTVTMALYKVKDIDEAIALTNSIQAYQGQGHSCGIYSYNDEHIMRLANATRTSPGYGEPTAGSVKQRQLMEWNASDLLAGMWLLGW